VAVLALLPTHFVHPLEGIMTTNHPFHSLLRNLEDLLAEPHTSLTAGLKQKSLAANLYALSSSSGWPWSNKTLKEMVQEKVSTAAYS
jgi:hypothetical protein